jgi:hypothetical protein
VQIRIINIKDLFLINAEVVFPDGIKMFGDDFNEIIKIAVENILNDVLFYPEDWFFKSSDKLDSLIIDTDTKKIFIPDAVTTIGILRNFLSDEQYVVTAKVLANDNPFIDKEL